jgi:hypothetical protein
MMATLASSTIRRAASFRLYRQETRLIVRCTRIQIAFQPFAACVDGRQMVRRIAEDSLEPMAVSWFFRDGGDIPKQHHPGDQQYSGFNKTNTPDRQVHTSLRALCCRLQLVLAVRRFVVRSLGAVWTTVGTDAYDLPTRK